MRQTEHTERQIVHQNQLIFSSIPMPSELNIGLLNTLFIFKPAVELITFLINKTQVWKTYYSLAEILTILKNVVRGEGLFHPANLSIILCSADLKRALNMKALHVTEVRNQLLYHVIKVAEDTFRRQFIELEKQREHDILLVGRTPRHPVQPVNMSWQMSQQQWRHVLQCRQSQENQGNAESRAASIRPIRPIPQVAATNNIMTAFINRNDMFMLRPKVLKVIQSVPGIGQERTIVRLSSSQ
jgi:hypothetical protein